MEPVLLVPVHTATITIAITETAHSGRETEDCSVTVEFGVCTFQMRLKKLHGMIKMVLQNTHIST